MNRKQKFLNAVAILAPNDLYMLKAAEKIAEESLPIAPGGVALEFVARMQRIRDRVPLPNLPPARPADEPGALPAIRLCAPSARLSAQPGGKSPVLEAELEASLRVKNAEYWISLGEPGEALRELDQLAPDQRKHPWALRVYLAAMKAVREMAESTVQE